MSPFSGGLATVAEVATATEATGVFALTWLLVGLPLLGAAVLLLGGRRTDRWGHWLGVLMSGGSFVVAVLIFFGMLGRSAEDRTITQHLFDWIAVGTFNVPFDLRVDQLSMTFVLLITGVGTLIHIYSVGYMSHDHDRRRFFA